MGLVKRFPGACADGAVKRFGQTLFPRLRGWGPQNALLYAT
jgi:hypothetical protein